jgi:hypothetical protein
MKAMTFPTLSARNLEGRNLELPGDFGAERNIAMVAFQRWHQTIVDSWVPWLDDVTTHHPQVQVYEIPILSQMYTFMRWMIDGGMRAAIPNHEVRTRTLTAYTDVQRVMHALGLPDTSTITILLVDRAGQIFWQGYGEYTPQKAAELEQALREHP